MSNHILSIYGNTRQAYNNVTSTVKETTLNF